MELSKENKDRLEQLPPQEQKRILSLFYNFCLKEELKKAIEKELDDKGLK